MILRFFLLVLRQVNAVVVAAISINLENLDVKVFNLVSGIMKQGAQNGMKRVIVTVVFVIINKFGMMINAGVNAKN